MALWAVLLVPVAETPPFLPPFQSLGLQFALMQCHHRALHVRHSCVRRSKRNEEEEGELQQLLAGLKL